MEEDEDFYLGTVEYGGDLESIPYKYKTYKFCLEILKVDGCLIKEVPEHLIDEEMCLEAVRQSGFALQCVPLKFRSEKVCLQALLSSLFISKDVMEFIPAHIQTEEMKNIVSNHEEECKKIIEFFK